MQTTPVDVFHGEQGEITKGETVWEKAVAVDRTRADKILGTVGNIFMNGGDIVRNREQILSRNRVTIYINITRQR